MSGPGHPLEEDDLHAFVDGQLTPERRRLVEDYLKAHPQEGSRVAAYQAQRNDLRALFAGQAAEELPPKLQLTNLLHSRARPPWERWALAASIVIAVALGVGGGWVLWGPRPSSLSERAMQVLIQEALTSYAVYAPDPRHPVEITAAEAPHLTDWLSNRLNRAVKAPDLSKFGYTLMGGRLLATEHGGPAAMLMYGNAGGNRLSLLLRPMLPTLRVADQEQGEGSVQLCAWITNGLGFALVSSIPRSELDNLADHVRDEFGAAG